jgi:hypothetical protein
MKKLFTAVLLAAAALFSVGAHAQAIETSFKDSASNVATLESLRSFECVTGGYKLTHTAESFGLTYADTSGMCAKMVASPFAQKYFIQVPGTNRYLNSLQARRVYMDGSNTKIIWNAGPEEYFTGSNVHTAFLSRAN